MIPTTPSVRPFASPRGKFFGRQHAEASALRAAQVRSGARCPARLTGGTAARHTSRFARDRLPVLRPMPNVQFDRFYLYAELTEILKSYAAEYPRWVSVDSIGKSHEGRDI